MMPGIKRTVMGSYYRAYKDYLNTMKGVSQFNNLKQSLRTSSKKDMDTFTGSVTHREIDLEWVEAIESALPYIDKSIHEQRRFISQTEEVVPIEKSKKVTTESVRHLAQHTNLIGRVENDKVTPKSILNIQRDESFDIYENRFLRSLILRTLDFVSNCYKRIKETPESTVAGLQMARDSVVDNQMFNIELKCDIEYNEKNRDFDVYGDISGMTEYERVIRIRKILSDFLALPLISNLASSPEVRSPITRTNLLTKDPNFRETLKLWEFLDNYNRVGFSIVVDDKQEKDQPPVQDGIYDVLALLQFVIKMDLSEGMRDSLEQNYTHELEKEEHQRVLEGEERERQVKKRIAAALTVQKAEHEQKLAEAEEHRLSDLKELDNSWQEKYDSKVAFYEAKLADLKSEYEQSVAELNRQFTDKYNAAVSEYEKLMAEKDENHAAEIAEQKAENDRNIEAITEQFNNKISAIEAEKQQIQTDAANRLADVKAEFESEKNNAVEKAVVDCSAEYSKKIGVLQKCNSELNDKMADCESKLKSVRSELSALRSELDTLTKRQKSVKAENEKLKSRIVSQRLKYEREIDAQKKNYLKNISNLSEKNAKKISKLNTQIEKMKMRENQPEQ